MAKAGVEVKVLGFVIDGKKKLLVVDCGDGAGLMSSVDGINPSSLAGYVVGNTAYMHLSPSPRCVGEVSYYPKTRRARLLLPSVEDIKRECE
ncbi:MAG: hypothetical protein KKB21_05285 [Nanoarchaeota archaeon]|nr:hypothetical protein [Nanoarchaeota archaeon]MBU4086960.1 hypothetical protein [Nanoarchaeota archaeon]